MKYKYHILLAIFSISLVVSLIISLTPTPIICDPNKGCDVVLNSAYASTFGIKNSYYGIVVFAILSMITYSHIINEHKRKKHFIHTGIIIGSAIALYFIYLQMTVLKAYCKYCLIIDFGFLVGLLIIVSSWKK